MKQKVMISEKTTDNNNHPSIENDHTVKRYNPKFHLKSTGKPVFFPTLRMRLKATGTLVTRRDSGRLGKSRKRQEKTLDPADMEIC